MAFIDYFKQGDQGLARYNKAVANPLTLEQALKMTDSPLAGQYQADDVVLDAFLELKGETTITDTDGNESVVDTFTRKKVKVLESTMAEIEAGYEVFHTTANGIPVLRKVN